MPYIKQEDREKFEPALRGLRAIVQKEVKKGTMNKGDLTYILYALGLDYFVGRESYTNVSSAMSCFDDAKEEIRRRHLNPYEDKKIEENGDVE